MIVRFHSKAYADITMFGDVAVRLLRLMGHSGTVPSAILPEDIPAALQRLRAGVERDAAATPDQDPSIDDEREMPVSLQHRAGPLIELLEAAQRQNQPVMWD